MAQRLPCALERESDRRRRRPPKVVRRDGTHRLERSLRKKSTQCARVLSLPSLELNEKRRRKYELDAVARRHSRKHEAACNERLESRRNGGDNETAVRLSHSVDQFESCGASRDGSRSSGSETSARATCDGTSMRLAGSTAPPIARSASSSSPCGRARRMSARRWIVAGGREEGTISSKAMVVLPAGHFQWTCHLPPGANSTRGELPAPLELVGSSCYLRDPVHGLVAFESDEEHVVERLLATPRRSSACAASASSA